MNDVFKDKYKKGKIMKKFILLSIFCFNSIYSINIDQKFYIDNEEFNAKNDGNAFYIHVGNNIWLTTNTIHRDDTGFFTYECDLKKNIGSRYQAEYQQKWKCPYCYNYWPIGKPCDNAKCPSKYK